MNLMIGSGMSILCYIAMRIITKFGNVTEGIKLANILHSELCSHLTLRDPTDHFRRSLMAAFILKILHNGKLFGQEDFLSTDVQVSFNNTIFLQNLILLSIFFICR